MEAPTFGGKPSDAHVIWRGSGGSVKRFDEELLRRWSSTHALDFESDRRVDHDRGSDPRTQYQVVFAWGDGASESFSVGDDEWEIRTQETPRTFFEVDSEGVARVRGWDSQALLDVHELRVDGSSLVVEAAELDGTKRLDARKLRSEPD
jgi:hypothetical protein